MIPIMIVEDEFLVRAGLRTSIEWEREGFEIVAEAQNGEEALDMFQKYRPRIVITDIRLPKMDGLVMMKEIQKLDSAVNFIIISAYDDFQYAKEAINIGVVNYFLKGNMDVNEFLKTLQKLRLKRCCIEEERGPIRQSTIKELYLGRNPSELAERHWKQAPECMYLLYFRTETANPQMLEAMLIDHFQQRSIKYIQLHSEKDCWFLYTWDNAEADTILEHVRHMFQRYVDENIIIIKSENLFGYPNMREAIYHVLLSYEYNHYSFRHHKKIGVNCGKQDFEAIKSLEKELSDRLKFQKYEEAFELLEEVRLEIISLVSPEALFKSIYKLMGVLAECDEELVASRVYESLMDSLDITYIFKTVKSFIEDLREKKEADSNIYILKVKEFIDKHYMEAIKIKDLSDYIHVSPNYLGKLFYLNTGEYLRDYINSVKLEKSRELLLSKKYQVSEVAVMVGIEDQRYFSKLFKKCYGVSPKEYGR